jgi:hypothetical protein
VGYQHRIATRGTPSPIQVGKRWVVERTHSWMNGFGKLRRSTDKTRPVVEFFLFLAAAITVIRRLITTARSPVPLGHAPSGIDPKSPIYPTPDR